MNSLYSFIVKPLNDRYNNKIKIGEQEIIVNTSVEEHKFISKKAIVVSVPLAFKTEIKVGDEVIIHHNIFRRWYDQHGKARNSSTYFKQDMYFAAIDQVYMYKKDGEWKTIGDRCFLKPIKNKDTYRRTFDKKLIGILKYGNSSLEASGISPGDLVGFIPDREWEFLIDEELLYCMKSNDIVIKYEYKGNEAEYNPSWAQSS